MNVNTDVAVTALAIIETHPERHDQENWRVEDRDGKPVEDFADDPLNDECGTSGCLAGWIAFLDRVKWAGNPVYPGLHQADRVADPDRCTCAPDERFCVCGYNMPISFYAQRRLGIDYEEASALFDPANTTDDLSAGVKAVVNGEDVTDAVHRSHAEHGNTKCDWCFPDGDDEGDDEE